MCTALTPLAADYGWKSADMMRLTRGWIKHQIAFPPPVPTDTSLEAPHVLPRSAQLSHPAIFELVGLPKNFDTLIEECSRRRCPKTGKDLADPVVCLMCGEIFCAQTMCCLMDYQEPGRPESSTKQLGGATQHMLFK